VTKPSRQDRLRPLELVVMAAVIAVFIGLVVLFSSRDVELAVIFFGVAFVVSLVVIAMLALAVKPGDAEKLDLTQQDDEAGGGH
jgi:predicted lysophospholipase L1 biosynthesis ABC-type transport system permease subunit